MCWIPTPLHQLIQFDTKVNMNLTLSKTFHFVIHFVTDYRFTSTASSTGATATSNTTSPQYPINDGWVENLNQNMTNAINIHREQNKLWKVFAWQEVLFFSVHTEIVLNLVHFSILIRIYYSTSIWTLWKILEESNTIRFAVFWH